MSDATRAGRPPLFSRAALLAGAFACCLITISGIWLLRGGQWSPTLPLPAALLTLLIVIPIGEIVRNRFRLSLRAIIAGMSAAALVLGMFGARWNEARLQRRAVSSLYAFKSRPLPTMAPLKPDVNVSYERNDDLGKDYVRTSDGWIAPGWLVGLLGDDFFFRVWHTNFQLIDLRDPSAFEGIDLRPFDAFHFTGCQFGQETLRRIFGTKHLKELYFTNCTITDVELVLLSQMRNLTTLQLRNNHSWLSGIQENVVTAEGIREITKLPSLKHLAMTNLGLRSGDLNALSQLPNLEYIDLADNAQITLDDIRFLRALPELKGIVLSGTNTDEKVLPFLRELPSLEWVTLSVSSPEVEQKLAAEGDREENPSLRVFVH